MTGDLLSVILSLEVSQKPNLIIVFVHNFERNNKYTVTRNRFDIALGNHALHAQPTDN